MRLGKSSWAEFCLAALKIMLWFDCIRLFSLVSQVILSSTGGLRSSQVLSIGTLNRVRGVFAQKLEDVQMLLSFLVQLLVIDGRPLFLDPLVHGYMIFLLLLFCSSIFASSMEVLL